MRKECIIEGIICFILVLTMLGISSTAFAGDPIRKLGRGLANTAIGMLEFPRQIVSVTEEDGYVAGMTYGIVKGIAMGVLREVVGVYEIATFLIPLPPHYEPIVEPEFLLSEEY